MWLHLYKSVSSVVKIKKVNYLLLLMASGLRLLMPFLCHAQVITGAERTELYYPLLKNKTIGRGRANNKKLHRFSNRGPDRFPLW